MRKTWDRFSELVREHDVLLGADAYLHRYSQTLMPPGEAEVINFQRKIQQEAAHEIMISSEMGELLEKLGTVELSARKKRIYSEISQAHDYAASLDEEPNPQSDWDRFYRLVQRKWALDATSNDLQYHQITHMKDSEKKSLENQVVVIECLSDRIFDCEEMRGLIEKLRDADLSDDQRAIYRGAVKEYNETLMIPKKFREKRILLLQKSNEIWPKARRKSNFGIIAPTLDRLVRLDVSSAIEMNRNREVYESLALWDDTFTINELDSYLRGLQENITPLIHAIGKQDYVDDSFLRRGLTPSKSKELQMWLLNLLGFNFNLGRVDEAEHPQAFGSRFSISKRVKTLGRVIGVISHEFGHAFYDQNLPREHYFDPLGTSFSMNIEEGITSVYEDHIGKSRAFWKAQLQSLRRKLPEILGEIELDNFYRAINKVKPGYISTYADEVTLVGHMVLRIGLEKKLGDGTLRAKDYPEAYNEGMQNILGITPPNDRLGALATSHLFDGLGNYTQYVFGSIIGSQLSAAMERDIPEMAERIGKRQIAEINEWLTKRIFRHGSRYTTKELIERATGKPLGPEDHIDYLHKKFGALYNLPIEMHNGVYRLKAEQQKQR